MQIVLFGYVRLNNRTVGLMKIRQHLQKLLVRLINPPYQVAHLVLLEVLGKSLKTALHELVDLDGVMILVAAVDGQTQRADEATVLAV